jgi:tRNA pseudouridine13 synthase
MLIDPLWLRAALDPPRAHGAPLGTGTLRATPEDFVVEEDLGFAPAGAGQHLLLKVRKRGANTQWVARELAKISQCRPMDVGYAGLKDRRAVAIQWFTVPKSSQTLDAWLHVRNEAFEILEAHPHARKLPRGALAANGFTIRVRDFNVADDLIGARVARIARLGVPNYFGPQRFGNNNNNLKIIIDGLPSLRGPQRGFVLSAARSLIFNALLAFRVGDESWDRLREGDLANLDGRGSIFPVDALDETLRERCERLDIHPTGAMWGRGVPRSRGPVLELEMRVAGELQQASKLVEEVGMDQERRSLRLAVRDLDWARESDSVVFRFKLTRGSFATTVVREIFDAPDAGDDEVQLSE